LPGLSTSGPDLRSELNPTTMAVPGVITPPVIVSVPSGPLVRPAATAVRRAPLSLAAAVLSDGDASANVPTSSWPSESVSAVPPAPADDPLTTVVRDAGGAVSVADQALGSTGVV
jgi:hypothetical protein